MKKYLLLSILSLSAALATMAVMARDAEILQRADSFSGKTLYFTPPERPTLEGGSFWSGRYVTIELEAVGPVADANSDYSLQVDANLESWIFIRAGASMALKIDGQMVPLSGDGSIGDRTVISGDSVVEVAYYDLPDDILQKIAHAHVVEFRVFGDNGTITGTFTDKMLADMRLFAEKAPQLIGAQPLGVAAVATSPAPAAPTLSTPSQELPRPLGVDFINVPWTMRHLLHVPKGIGVWVLNVKPDSAAQAAGIAKGDVIVSFDGKDIHNSGEMQQAVTDHPPGEIAAIAVLRDGSAVTLKAKMSH